MNVNKKRKRNENDNHLLQQNTNTNVQRKMSKTISNAPNSSIATVARNVDLYEILEVDHSSQIQEIKSSYFRLARLYHPDRVDLKDKESAIEKFKTLHQAYSILSNIQTKSRYDSGDMSTLYSLNASSTYTAKWNQYIRTVNENDIKRARQSYQGSLAEESDIVREFVFGKGSITHLLNTIPFMRIDDEPRIISFIKNCIEIGKVPGMKIKKIKR